MICKLKKAIYDLKRSLRAWLKKIQPCCLWRWFSTVPSDSVFIHHSSVGSAILAIYVDDILLTESYTNGIENANDYLKAHFMTKDMEDLDTSLGLWLLTVQIE